MLYAHGEDLAVQGVNWASHWLNGSRVFLVKCRGNEVKLREEMIV